MALRAQHKGKGIRDIPVETTKVMGSTFRPPRTAMSRPLRDVDINMSSSSQGRHATNMLLPGNSETQNIANPGSTWPSRTQLDSNAGIVQSPVETMPVRNMSDTIYENFRVSHTLQKKKSPYEKQKM